jgi:Flp pilus assembly protein CpaB
MRRSPRVVVAWLLAAVVALATARIVGGDLAALHRRARNLGPAVGVVLAARDLPLGAAIKPSDLRVVQRPASTVAPDAVHNVADAAGHVLVLALLRDDVVGARALTSADRRGLDAVIPPGKRGIHVVVKDGFRPPIGAVVDVLAALDTDTTATLVATGAQVLALDDNGVTLLVRETEAPAVAWAALVGGVSVALAPPEDASG